MSSKKARYTGPAVCDNNCGRSATIKVTGRDGTFLLCHTCANPKSVPTSTIAKTPGVDREVLKHFNVDHQGNRWGEWD